MPQYLADIKEKEFFILNEEARHLTRVARHQEGDEIRVFDGKGKQFTARITRVQKDFVRGDLLEPIPLKKSALSLQLCFAPTSRNTLEEVLDKCTQLGVSSFQPISTRRSEYDLLKNGTANKTAGPRLCFRRANNATGAMCPACSPRCPLKRP